MRFNSHLQVFEGLVPHLQKVPNTKLIHNGKHNEMWMTISFDTECTFYKNCTVKVQIYEHEKNNKANDTTWIVIK